MVFILFVIYKSTIYENNRVDELETFKDLGSVLQKSSGFEEDTMHRIQCRLICTHMYTTRVHRF